MRLVFLVLAACSSGTSERVYSVEELPVREWTLGLPVSGDGGLRVSKSLLNVDDWSTAKGHVVFRCEDCEFGDNYAQMQLGEPIGNVPFSYVELGEVTAHADFANGRMHLVSKWRSAELELDAWVDATLERRAADSYVRGCVMFRPTETLLERDPKMHALISTTGAARNEAGWFAITLEGPFGEMRRLAKPCPP